MSKDFRDLRRQRQEQGIVTPEDVYNVTLPNRETSTPLDSDTVSPSSTDEEENSDHVVKTSFYPTQEQLNKLDDLAGEYNKLYRRQRKRIDRQDIIRHLINQCTLESLTELQ